MQGGAYDPELTWEALQRAEEILVFGYPAEEPVPGSRKAKDDIVFPDEYKSTLPGV